MPIFIDKRQKSDAERQTRTIDRSAKNHYLCHCQGLTLPPETKPIDTTMTNYTRISTYIDLIFCLVILPLLIMLVPVEKWIIHHTYFMLTLIVYIYLLYFTYRKANIPGLVMQRKFEHVVILFTALLLITWGISQIPIPKDDFINSPRDWGIRQHIRTLSVWFFFLVVTGFSLTIEVTVELFRQILSKQEIEAEKNKAELALYKAQINPHFLFNTLNALYGLVLTKSDKTESAFIQFSNILKYMYAQTTLDTIPICNEIDYIRQYVDLQSLRLNKHTHIEFHTETDDEQAQIPPMILITFVENAFKYGTSSDIDCTVYIKIAVKSGELVFETENSIMKEKKEPTPAIGIENCRKRLELLYPDRFTLVTAQEGNQFKTKLTIQLQ